jgi:hypothetical protein
MSRDALKALHIPAEFWQRDDVTAAIAACNFRDLFRLITGKLHVTQNKLAATCGLTHSAISQMIRPTRTRHPTTYDVRDRIATGLQMPDHHRLRLGLAPMAYPPHDGADPHSPSSVAQPPAPGPTVTHHVATIRSATASDAPDATTAGQRGESGRPHRPGRRRGVLRSGRPSAGTHLLAPAVLVARQPTRYDHVTIAPDDTVYRRDTLRLASTAIPALLLRTADVASALTTYGCVDPADEHPPSVTELANATAVAKRSYQACHYTLALDQVASLLSRLQAVRSEANAEQRLSVETIAAAAYQVAGSLLLKFGDTALAAMAADRSMDAALRSQDPLPVAASARLLTHALMSAGHTTRAQQLASAAAQDLEGHLQSPSPSPEAISVYGALILRAAIAAARAEDRTAAHELLTEAQRAARLLGRDDNAHWTAFGPTNVQLHRVNVAVLLGDAGTAINLAAQIDPHRITLAERRATLLIDIARAYDQWGKLDRCLEALLDAEQLAPEEMCANAAVHDVLSDLIRRAPHTVRARAALLANRIGLAA